MEDKIEAVFQEPEKEGKAMENRRQKRTILEDQSRGSNT